MSTEQWSKFIKKRKGGYNNTKDVVHKVRTN